MRWLVAIVLLMAGTAHAQISISLPDAGWYRPGQCVPVRVVSNSTPDAKVTVVADAVPTVVSLRNDASLTVPLLILSSDAKHLTYQIDNQPPQELATPLQVSPTGPAPIPEPSAVYSAMSALRGEWDRTTRSRVVLAGILIAIAYLACLLLRGARSLILVALTTIVALMSIEMWRRHLPAAQFAMGRIIVEARSHTITDDWTLITAMGAGGEVFVRANLGTIPLLLDPEQARRMQIEYRWDLGGGVIRAILPRGGRLAVLSRTITSAAPAIPTVPATTSVFLDLAQTVYTSPRLAIVGQSHEDGTILLQEK